MRKKKTKNKKNRAESGGEQPNARSYAFSSPDPIVTLIFMYKARRLTATMGCLDENDSFVTLILISSFRTSSLL